MFGNDDAVELSNRDDDVLLVMKESGACLNNAQEALERNNGDVCNAIMDLTKPIIQDKRFNASITYQYDQCGNVHDYYCTAPIEEDCSVEIQKVAFINMIIREILRIDRDSGSMGRDDKLTRILKLALE